VDKDLEDALDRLLNSDCIEDQVNREIIRYWNERVHRDDVNANRIFRKLLHEFVFEDSNKNKPQ